jgi:hypothetical protein
VFDWGLDLVISMGDNKAAVERFASAMDSLVLLGESMQQASALLADDEAGDAPKASTSFLSVVALGNVVRIL